MVDCIAIRWEWFFVLWCGGYLSDVFVGGIFPFFHLAFFFTDYRWVSVFIIHFFLF